MCVKLHSGAELAPTYPIVAADTAFDATARRSVLMDSPVVLVVDDEPHICLLVRETLRQAGIAVRSAADGRQALSALDESDPSLILLDVGLPDIDGFSLCARIRE